MLHSPGSVSYRGLYPAVRMRCVSVGGWRYAIFSSCLARATLTRLISKFYGIFGIF